MSEQESVKVIGYSRPSLSPEDSQLVADVQRPWAEDKYDEAHQLVASGVADPDEPATDKQISARPFPASQ